jgi:hypothetical protein
MATLDAKHLLHVFATSGVSRVLQEIFCIFILWTLASAPAKTAAATTAAVFMMIITEHGRVNEICKDDVE